MKKRSHKLVRLPAEFVDWAKEEADLEGVFLYRYLMNCVSASLEKGGKPPQPWSLDPEKATERPTGAS
jgi:hypothetical protein